MVALYGTQATVAVDLREATQAGAKHTRARVARVVLLGGFRLTVDHRPVTLPASSQRIISLLALRGRFGRSRLAGSLWPETTELRALARLRTALWRSNQLVPGLLVSNQDTVGLDDSTEVDVTSLVHLAHDVFDGVSDARPNAPGLGHIEVDLLPDWNDDWLVVDRERMRQLRLHVLEALAAQLAKREMFGLAMEAALAALRTDSLRESAHRAVIRIHLAEGNLAEARSAYEQCCAVLAREIGAGPSRATAQLAQVWAGPPVRHDPRHDARDVLLAGARAGW